MRDEVDDTDMTVAEFRAAMGRGVPARVVTSREEFEAHAAPDGPRFELYQDRAGRFRFRLRAGSGEVLATSGPYATRAAAVRGAESVQSAAESASIVDVAS